MNTEKEDLLQSNHPSEEGIGEPETKTTATQSHFPVEPPPQQSENDSVFETALQQFESAPSGKLEQTATSFEAALQQLEPVSPPSDEFRLDSISSEMPQQSESEPFDEINLRDSSFEMALQQLQDGTFEETKLFESEESHGDTGLDLDDSDSGLQFLESNAPGSALFHEADAEPEEEEEETRSVFAEIMSWIIPMAAAVVVALVLKNYVIINANVPSGSMLNTIQKGDDLFGNRLSYYFTDPKRGDIIIFYYPDDPTTKYIKRIIGEPGDKVVIEDAKIYINDSAEPLEEDYLPEEWVKNNDGYVFQVPEDHYLMLGDNRNDSWDSRFWNNTYVSRDAIIGKAWLIYYPFDHIKTL